MKKNVKVMKDKNAKCKYCGHKLFENDKPTGALRVFYDGKINDVCHNSCYLSETDRSKLKICVHATCRSIGDTISFTPIIRELRRLYPSITIDVLSYVPEIFKYNPHITNNIPFEKGMKDTIFIKYDRKIEPFQPNNNVFPMHMLCHSVDFVSYGAFRKILNDEDKHYEIPCTEIENDNMYNISKQNGFNPFTDRYILVHPHGTEWGTRTWSQENWQNLVNQIKDKYPDYKIVSIGGSRNFYSEYTMKNYVKLDGVIDMYNKLSLLETLPLMDLSCATVTTDTGTIHMAGATNCRILGIFTVVHSRYRAPYRDGIKGKDCWFVDSEDCSCTYTRGFLDKSISIEKCCMGHEPLKCHPSVDRVFKEFEEMMK